MMRPILTVPILALLFLTSCKNSGGHKRSELPEATNISVFQQTDFVPTLESPVNSNKNIIYAAAFQYAWDQVKQQFTTPISLSEENSNAFKSVNQSASYKNTLTENEYSAEAEIVDDGIVARAFFNKTLPFPSQLQKLEHPISFNETEVLAFGMQSYDRTVAMFTEILYYKDDEHFVLKLTPKDKEHQIILVKGIGAIANLMAAVKQTNDLINIGNNEKGLPQMAWKYSLNDIDIFSIPRIQFNIEKNYEDIEGQVFTSNGKRHHVETAYQRTGFILNETGAVVESEVVTATDSSAAEPIKIQPKKMVFDKPFFVIIKRTKSDNPYFVMYVRNSELLAKK